MNIILLTLSFYAVVALIHRSRNTSVVIDPVEYETIVEPVKEPIKLELECKTPEFPDTTLPSDVSLFLIRVFACCNPDEFPTYRQRLIVLPRRNRNDLIHFLRSGYSFPQSFNLIAHIQHAKSYGHKVSAEQVNKVIKSFS